ncbi:MAG: hypothetical protein OXG64_01525 [Chloroflexi bacterium]|nr:hypothetical protein [Chloroflexota bacterium]
MRHPATRFLLATVIAALSASLVVGTALAEGPVPRKPPGDAPLSPPGEIEIVEEYSVTPISDIDFPTGLLATSGGCKSQNYSKKIRQRVNGEWLTRVHVGSNTDFCYDGTYIVDEPEELDCDKGDWYNETAGWERVKFKTSESGGHDWKFHSDLVDAKYKQCLPLCGNHTNIYVHKTQHGNGTVEKRT